MTRSTNIVSSRLARRIALLLSTMALAGAAAFPLNVFAQEQRHDPLFEIGAINLIGWDGVTPGSHGQLRFDAQGIEFLRDGIMHRIDWFSLRRFALERTSRGLIRGTGGTIASFSPQGAGQLYSAIRPGAQALSLLYSDEQQGLHAAVVILPAKCRDDILQAFDRAGFQPSPLLSLPVQARSDLHFVAPIGTRENDEPDQVRVEFPRAATQAMPAAYGAELYEETLTQVTKSRRFTAVWRDGDRRAGPSSARLTTTITRVRKGNPGVRGAIPVLGMVLGKTQIEADVTLTTAGGDSVLDTRLKGAKSMPGESIGASKALARHVSRSIEKADQAN